MSQQPALQHQELPVQRQQQQIPEWRRGGGGGGGGGGHRHDDYSPEEVAQIFEQLAKASAQFFSSDAEFLITEQSAQHLLTNTFETLAQATRKGALRAGLPKLVDGSSTTRSKTLHNITTRSITKGTPPVFDESDSASVLENIKNCLLPDVPK
jgi:hypothetical protein